MAWAGSRRFRGIKAVFPFFDADGIMCGDLADELGRLLDRAEPSPLDGPVQPGDLGRHQLPVHATDCDWFGHDFLPYWIRRVPMRRLFAARIAR
jgi:hypothetical protein